MTLLSPAFLWAFLAVIPLAAIYFLKVRPRKHIVTAAFLWQRVFTENKATSLFQRLRDLLSLLLLLLAVSALVFALTRPKFENFRNADIVLLIDHSASMNAMAAGRTQLGEAKRIANEITKGVGGDQRIAIASISNELVYHSYLSDDPRTLRDALDAILPTALPFDSHALAEVAPLAKQGEHLRVILLSDGVASSFTLPEGVEWMQVGEQADNAGIIAADLQAIGQPGQLSLFFQLASNLDEPVEADVRVMREDIPIKIIPITIQSGKGEPYHLDLVGEPGVYHLSLIYKDALAMDNDVSLSVPERKPIRVAVAAQDRYFFEHSVEAFTQSDGRLLLERDPQSADLSIGQASSPQGSLSIIFTPDGESPWWDEVGEPIDLPVPRALAAEHSVLRYIPVEDLSFAGARVVTPAKGSRVLVVDQSNNPLIWQANQDGRTALVFNLDPAESDFVFSPYFPVLIYSATTYLGGSDQPIAAVYATVDRVPLPGATPDSMVSITLPDGSTQTLPASQQTQLQTPGVYKVESDLKTTNLAGALLNPGESGADQTNLTANAQPVPRGWSAAMWLLLIALIILVAEELAYHRRKVG